MAKSAGSKYYLFSLFGWLSSTPDNLTREERENGFRASGKSLQDKSAGVKSRYYEETTPNQNTVEHFSELEEMAESDIINPIVELYAEECTQPDVASKKTVWFECVDGGVEEDLNQMLERVGVENLIYSVAYSVCATGNAYWRVLRSRENGVEKVVSVPTPSIERIYDETTRRLLGFDWAGNTPYGDQEIVIGSKSIFAPWEFIHFRRLKDTTTEYGVSLLSSVWPLYKKIRLAVDHMVQYRMQMMPTRHAMMIDVDEQGLLESAETVNMMKMLMRNSVLMDARNGYMDSRYHPPGMDSILYFPKRKDDTTSIETLQGTTEVPDVYDLDLLYKKLFAAARVPKAYVGFEENTGIAQASLVSQDIRFARMIRVLRKPLIEGLMKLGQLHLALKGINPESYKLEVHMSRISALEEELNAATLERQADMANTLVNLCQTLEIPNREIIDLVFREYLHVPRHFVDLAKLAAAVEQAVGASTGEGAGAVGGMGGGFSGGLGVGGMGDENADFTADTGGNDLAGLEDELGLGGEDPTKNIPQERGKPPWKGVPLVEADKRKLREAIYRIKSGRKILSESKVGDKEKLTEVTRSVRHVRNVARQISDIQRSGKSSLVEVYAKVNPFISESLPNFSNLTEEKAKIIKIAEASEARIVSAPSFQRAPQEVHEAVRIAKNIRRKARA